jgi:hypothetical protein
MKVRFLTSKEKLLLDMELESAPRRDEMIVIGDLLFEILNVKHVFTPGRGGKHDYLVVVIVQPL